MLSDAERPIDDHRVRQAELAISLVLRIGVSVSVLVIASGLGLMMANHPEYISKLSYHAITRPGASFPHSLGALIHSLARGQGRGITVLGIGLLILTPVMRVAVSIFTFIYEQDPAFVIITTIVLAILIGSFFLGGAGG
jgi:uncharacterized membrane protein